MKTSHHRIPISEADSYSETIELSINFIKFCLDSSVLLSHLIQFPLQFITFAFQRSYFTFEMFGLDINLTKSKGVSHKNECQVYFSVVSLRFLSFCSASSSNKATFLNKLSLSPRAPLSSFSSPLNFSNFSSYSSSFFSRSSLRCVREVISWSFEVLDNSSDLTFELNSSIFS